MELHLIVHQTIRLHRTSNSNLVCLSISSIFRYLAVVYIPIVRSAIMCNRGKWLLKQCMCMSVLCECGCVRPAGRHRPTANAINQSRYNNAWSYPQAMPSSHPSYASCWPRVWEPAVHGHTQAATPLPL